jgi:biopolymer transport protein ExbD
MSVMRIMSRVTLQTLATVLVVAQMVACSQAESPTIVKLKISEQGEYSLDELPVPREALAAALGAKKQPPRTLLVQVLASPQAKSESVLYATKVARDSGAALAFVGNEKF